MPTPVDYEKFIHPQDRMALKALKAIPFFDTLIKGYLSIFDEKLMRGINMASKIRLSPTQLPEYYNLLPEICDSIGIKEPEFYLEMNPLPNAYTFGDTNPFIVINSGIIDLLSKDELKAVIAHECGHILCHHVLYNSVARCVVNLGFNLFGIPDAALKPIIWGLMYWSRRSEFSSDRVAAYVMDNSETVVKTMIRLSGGGPSITDRVNIKEYLAQADEYANLLEDSKYNKLLQAYAIKEMDHPFSAVRSREINLWFDENKDDLPPKIITTGEWY